MAVVGLPRDGRGFSRARARHIFRRYRAERCCDRRPLSRHQLVRRLVELHGEAPTAYQGTLKNLSMNFGYGIENNRDQDLLVGMRKRNQTYMINRQYKFSPNFTFALEYRRVLTDWFREASSKQRLNWVSLGYLFHSDTHLDTSSGSSYWSIDGNRKL